MEELKELGNLRKTYKRIDADGYKEKHKVRWYVAQSNGKYRAILEQVSMTKREWDYLCTIEKLPPINIVESFVLKIEDRPLWGHNQSWDWAEFQIDHFMIGYLLEKKNG